METVVLTDLPFTPNLTYLKRHLRIPDRPAEERAFEDLAAEAAAVARPKAIYGLAVIEERGDDFIVLAGVRFKSRVLAVNTEPIQRLFPFVVTCGTELFRWAEGKTDMLVRFYADELKLAALRSAVRQLEKNIKGRYETGRISQMCPGSLEDWPIQEQRPLFRLMGDTETAIGVRLKSSLLMTPDKSESGFYFQNETGFASCQLCPVKNCPSRKAPYDKALYDAQYRKTGES